MDHPVLHACADRGKVSEIPVKFEGDHWVVEEPETYVNFNIFFDESGLHSPKLARRLLKAIILPKDREMTKTHYLDKVIPYLYPSLLKIIVPYLSRYLLSIVFLTWCFICSNLFIKQL